MTWQPGHERIEDLLAAGELEQVTPADSVASLLLEDAGRHLATAAAAVETGDLAGGLSTRLRRAAEERRQPARRPGTPCDKSWRALGRPGSCHRPVRLHGPRVPGVRADSPRP